MPRIAKSTLTIDKSTKDAPADHVLRAIKLFAELQEQYARHCMLRVKNDPQYCYGAEALTRLAGIAKHFFPADVPADFLSNADFQKFNNDIMETERFEGVIKFLAKKELRLFVNFFKKGGQPFEREILLRFDRR